MGMIVGAMASIQIMHPKELKQKLGTRGDGQIKASLGNFGHILYGSSILGQLIYPKRNTDGCRDFSGDDFFTDIFGQSSSELQPVIMVDRGTCSFVAKVRNLEKLGLKLAVIADTQEEDSENLIMSDDGTGHSITIPSFIIRKKDADIMKAAL